MENFLKKTRLFFFGSSEAFLKAYFYIVMFAMKCYVLYVFRAYLTSVDIFWIPSYFLPEIIIVLIVSCSILLIKKLPISAKTQKIIVLPILFVIDFLACGVLAFSFGIAYRIGIIYFL